MTNLSDTLAALSAKATPDAYLYVRPDGWTTVERQPQPDWVRWGWTETPLYRTGQLVPVPSVERIARVIADQLGDDYSMVPKNKGEWLRARGMCGGFPRDINMPFRSDYDAAATAVIAAMQEGRDG